MEYNFDKGPTRRGTNCFKWDVLKGDGVLPMWVADMDFAAAPEIQRAIEQRVSHGVFGYTMVPDSYFEAVDAWFGRHHNFHLQKDWMIYTTGVVPALSAVIKALTKPGDGVILQTPVYNCFFTCVTNNGCEVVENPLLNTDEGWRMDYDDLERKAAMPGSKLLVLCNPHNPVGRVWKAEEMLRLEEICRRNDVIVVADEIHCGLVMTGHKYTPYASLSEHTMWESVSCNSASKSFNIAGLQLAYIFTGDEEMRKRIDRAININEVCDVNPLGIVAQTAAYNEGDEWLKALNAYIEGNYHCLCEHFAKEMPEVKISTLEGTYLVWTDLRQTAMYQEMAKGMAAGDTAGDDAASASPTDRLVALLEDKAKVKVSSGTIYGKTMGEGFIRINLACPRSQVVEALQRITKTLND